MMITLGGILGGCIGEPLGLVVPTGFLYGLFMKSFSLDFYTQIVPDHRVVVWTFGFKILIDLFGVIGMIAGLYHSK